jgi:ABC-type nitrate/sulfonate/bicarbonate transport system substrate-binding protein
VTRLRVCTFSGASSLPLMAAEELGLFSAAGVEVDLVQTRSSDELMRGLLDGTFEIVHAAPDNYIAWRDRTDAPIVAWIGGTSGPVSLVAQPGIAAVEDLRGRTIGVDAPTSGFVSAFRRMLRGVGLSPDDVTFEIVGATQLRATALREGRIDASMLTLPWSAAIEREGFAVLGDTRAASPRLQGSSGGSLQPWLDAEPETADAYLRALVAALTWLQLPGSEERTRDIIARRYDIDPDLAETVRRAFVDPVAGWPPSALIDPVGMQGVCDLRTENGEPPRHGPEAYVSLEPYRRVLGFGLLA